MCIVANKSSYLLLLERIISNASNLLLLLLSLETPKMPADYTIYYAPTPNGKKITLAMEEMGLNYELHNIHFAAREQYAPEYVKINPNARIPALVDHTVEGGDLVIFESGAILEYLADKTGKFLPPHSDIHKRMAVLQWLYWQMSGFGPMCGQVGIWYKFSKVDVPAAKERYLTETIRLYGVLDKQLADNKYVAGDEYSIADMAMYWWSFVGFNDEIKEHFEQFENVIRWREDMAKREAVRKANAVPFE